MTLARRLSLFLGLRPPLRCPPVRARGPPNILWITVEDMSPRLASYGDATVPTPNLDRLARAGVRYTRAFGVYGVCAPNRHALILGMYPTSTGAMAMRTWTRTSAIADITDPELLAIPIYEATPPPEARCFPEYLRAAGYFCTNNVKTDYQFQDPVVGVGRVRPGGPLAAAPGPDVPFFSVFNFTVTHESGTFEARSPAVTDPAAVALPPYYPDTPIVRRDVARHYDNIAAMDGQVGAVLRQLEEDGLAESTVVFFFSDHGDGLPRTKRWVYDSGLHVPFLVRFPDGRGGRHHRRRARELRGLRPHGPVPGRGPDPRPTCRARRFSAHSRSEPRGGTSTRHGTAWTRPRRRSGRSGTRGSSTSGTTAPTCPTSASSPTATGPASCRRSSA